MSLFYFIFQSNSYPIYLRGILQEGLNVICEIRGYT